MNIDDAGSIDECERLLRQPLKTPNKLSVHEEQTIKQSLKWYRGNTDTELSLVHWMSVSRIIGENIAIQLDTGSHYHYFRFDKDRNRVVIIDPHDNAQVPVEEADVASLYETSSVMPVTARTIQPKTYENLTAVSNETHGTKVVLGRYEDAFIQHTDSGETIQYEPKVSFSLPDPMAPDEIEDWLAHEKSDPVKNIVIENAEKNWNNPDYQE